MPVWLIPALKSILPHIGTIVTAAAPAFTKKSADAAVNQTLLLQKQITELQAAVTDSDEHIKKLAAQIKSTIEVVEKITSLTENRHRLIFLLSASAIIISVISLCAALYIILIR